MDVGSRLPIGQYPCFDHLPIDFVVTARHMAERISSARQGKFQVNDVEIADLSRKIKIFFRDKTPFNEHFDKFAFIRREALFWREKYKKKSSIFFKV